MGYAVNYTAITKGIVGVLNLAVAVSNSIIAINRGFVKSLVVFSCNPGEDEKRVPRNAALKGILLTIFKLILIQ